MDSALILKLLLMVLLVVVVLGIGWQYLRMRQSNENESVTNETNDNNTSDTQAIDIDVDQLDQVFPTEEKLYNQIKALESIRRDFVSNASHELRTPVSVIYGYLEMMKQVDASEISAQWQPAIDQMYEQTERIKKIIEDMLLLSRLEESDSNEKSEYIDIVQLLESAYKDASILSGNRKHQLHIDTVSGYFLLCNRNEIESLVSNLISNAIRYTPENGSISIVWQINQLYGNGNLSVSDTGIGIPKQDIPRVTERFYRSDPARSRETGGTGLGLAIVNHIVNRHQANLIIESEPGIGSTFTVVFPAKRLKKQQNQVDLLLN